MKEPFRFVVGHRSPDTDAIVSAHVFAWLHNQLNPAAPVRALRLGEPNPQTRWLFATAGEPLPELRLDCRPTAGEVAQTVRGVSGKVPLGAALRMIQKSGGDVLPVVSEDGTVRGLVSNRSPKTNFMLQCNIEDMVGSVIGLEELGNGLNLIPLNARPTSMEPRRIRVASVGSGVSGHFRRGDLVFCGDYAEAIQSAAQAEAAAIVLAELSWERAVEYADLVAVPVFYCPGSLLSALSRLGGCFPCAATMESEFESIDATMPLTECRAKLLRSATPLPVLDEAGRLIGTLSIRRLLEIPPPQVALVDHFESAQSIAGLVDADIFCIVDHHRIGDVQTHAPVEVDCRQWGSTSTILAARARERGVTLTPTMARLLLGALIADTLLLRSPTTTEVDRRSAGELARLAGVSLDAFGLEVLRRNDRLAEGDSDELVKTDCKAFKGEGRTFLVSQIETVDLGQLTAARVEQLRAALERRRHAQQADFAVVMISDVLQTRSRIELVCPDAALSRALSPESVSIEKNWTEEGWVSRKQQMIPYILRCLRAIES